MSEETGGLPARVAASLRREPELIPPGSRVLVALSGGPDSMALLHVLLELRSDLDLDLEAAHFDHGLRPDSAEEAERVAGWAREAGVACRVGRSEGDLPASQKAFRDARYDFLQGLADEREADRLATGHHADDQAETVLFRILRGTGIHGLAGIPRRRGRVVRPLLPFWREAIEAYVEDRSVPHLRDPSNLDPRWERARIRGTVLPALEAAWDGSVRARLVDLAEAARRADRALDREAGQLVERAVQQKGGPFGEEAWRLQLAPLREADPEIRGRAVRKLAGRLDVRLSRGGTRVAAEFISEGRSGGRVDLGEGLQLAREFDHVWLGRRDEPRPDETLTVSDRGPGSGEVWIGGRRWRVSWGLEPSGETARHRIDLPLDRLEFPLRVRGWRDGDRLRLPSGTRKLKELFHEHRVPLSERARVPLLAANDGSVLWAAGLGRDEAMVRRGDEEALWIEMEA